MQKVNIRPTAAAAEKAAAEVETNGTVSREEIAALAFCYWQKRGCQSGSAEDDWLRAEQELIAKIAASGNNLTAATGA
jgi:hypothetical protein